MVRETYITDGCLSLTQYLPEDNRASFDNWQDPGTRNGFNFIMADSYETYSTRKIRQRFLSAIMLNETREIIGTIGLSPEGSPPDLAIWMYRPYRGKGYGTRAFKLAIKYLFETLGLDEIYAGCYPGNRASEKMLARCGFVPHPEGDVHEKHHLTGEPLVQRDFVLKRPKIVNIDLAPYARTICISDIHGCLDLFRTLLRKVNFCERDMLILLGDYFSRGKQGPETLKYVMALTEQENVLALRGNWDFPGPEHSAREAEWMEGLAHIIESEDHIFVHAGYDRLSAHACMKNDAFAEKGLVFDKTVVAGHWPTINYCRGIPSVNPIIDERARIISVDGGCGLKDAAQLNALIIEGGKYSFAAVDNFEKIVVARPQAASENPLSITWNDRFIQCVEAGEEFGLYRHTASGREMALPESRVWTDKEGRLCECDLGTDYFLPVEAGDEVSVVARFSDRIFAKKNGVLGWIKL